MRQGGMESPPGVLPNFDNPEKLVYNASIVTQALCISIIGLVVAVRVYVRVHVLRSFTLEDWLLVAGFVSG
jgi:NO-binding membrane sensor protein with MHYT domain